MAASGIEWTEKTWNPEADSEEPQYPAREAAWRLQNGRGGADDVAVARGLLARTGGVTRRLRAAGWVGDARPTDEIIGKALQTLLDEPMPAAPQEQPRSRALRDLRLSISTLMTTQPEPIDCVLRGLPLGSVGVILGTGGVGKSMLVLHVAHAVATGHDDLGCLLDPMVATTGRVVYLAGEDGADILHHRLHAFADHVADDRRDDVVRTLEERVDIVPLVGSAPNILDGGGCLNEEAVSQIRDAAKGTRLLIIDPLRQFHAGDENDNGAMTILIKALAQIAHDERCAIIMVHHVSKAGARDDDGDAAMSRGAVAITDNARWVMAVAKMAAQSHERAGLPGEPWQYLTDRLVKANYTEIGPVAILTRGEGGVLQPLPPMPERDPVAEVVAKIHRDDDVEALDPSAASSPRANGYEDRDLFGAA